jgi:hypothetical protein
VNEWLERIIAGGVTLFIGWSTWITKRQFKYLSRSEHDAICEKRSTETKEALERIELALVRDRTETALHREKLTQQLSTMHGRIAVLYDRSARSED